MLEEQIEAVLQSFAREISDAAQQRDFGKVQRLTDAAAKVAAAKEQLGRVTDKRGLRDFSVVVTDGALQYDYLNVTNAVNNKIISAAETMTIQHGASGFTTVVLPRKYLQERSGIAAFYDAAHVHAGDVVVLTEIDKGIWRISKR